MVVLPLPFGPIGPCTSDGPTLTDTSCSAWMPPNSLVMRSASMRSPGAWAGAARAEAFLAGKRESGRLASTPDERAA